MAFLSNLLGFVIQAIAKCRDEPFVLGDNPRIHAIRNGRLIIFAIAVHRPIEKRYTHRVAHSPYIEINIFRSDVFESKSFADEQSPSYTTERMPTLEVDFHLRHLLGHKTKAYTY